MSWNDNDGDDFKNPWGNRNENNRRRNNSSPGDLDDLINQGKDQFKRMMPGNSGKGIVPGISMGIALIAVLWLASGFYRVREGEQAAVIRFGKFEQLAGSGLRYHFPYPIEEVIIQRVDNINRIDSDQTPLEIVLKSGFRTSADQPLMITGDENIVDITYTVLWHVSSLEQFLFQARDPADTMKVAAESIIREIIAQNTIADALTKSRGKINDEAREKLQQLVDEYKLGIQVDNVLLRRVDPPTEVIEAYRDVQKARTDQERLVNIAETYRNDIVPVAEGQAIQIVQDAEAYKAARIIEAEGNAKKFGLILSEYKQAPNVLTTRIALETKERILKDVDKIIMDGDKAQSVLPYMALPALEQPKATNSVKEDESAESQASVAKVQASVDTPQQKKENS